jgi:hypothetical protein
MLSTSFESPEEDEGTVLRDVSQDSPSTQSGSLQDDVERLIEIAAELFSAIERQIHLMEEELVTAYGEQVRPYAQTVFKERLISCAKNLDTSLQEIALNLERRSIDRSFSGPRHNNSYT